MLVAFHTPHFSERGTSVALYDYANHNEKILGNKSLIIYQKNHKTTNPKTQSKFGERFRCISYTDNKDLENILKVKNPAAVYHICYGTKQWLPNVCPNLVHSVFHIDPHGDRYAAVSESLSKGQCEFVPHMIDLPRHNENLRSELQIPNDAIVVGRHGGIETFDIEYLSRAIKDALDKSEKLHIVLLNTAKLDIESDRIHYLPATWDLHRKVAFINACDAMLHASSMGETFGLAVGEFSTLNKPILTTNATRRVSTITNSHLDILKDKAVLYNSQEELTALLTKIPEIVAQRTDWRAYQEYSPHDVMKKFQKVFLEGIPAYPTKTFDYSGGTITLYQRDAITGNLEKGTRWEPHLTALFKELVSTTDTILDVGAHVGLHSLDLARLSAHTHSFEPCAYNRALLKKNISDNNLVDKITVYNVALGDENTSADITRSNQANMGDNSVHNSDTGILQFRTLDSLNIDNINLIKIDIQGAEVKFLRGATETIKKARPYMIIEVEEPTLNRYGESSKSLFDKIRELDYSILLVKCDAYPVDHLCVPTERYVQFCEKYSTLMEPITGNHYMSKSLQNGIDKQISF